MELSFKKTKDRHLGISTLTTALVAIVLVLAIGVGAVSYEYSTLSSQGNAQTETTTNVLVSTTSVTVLSTTTILVTATSGNPKIPANMPKTCLTSYANGLDLNYSNYFIITNFTSNFAQVCVEYTYYPQNATNFGMNPPTNFSAMFNYSTMYFVDSFGSSSQGGPMGNLVSANPSTFLFTTTGESVVVDYTFQWSYIFSYFIPTYTICDSTLFGIGIAQTSGNGMSGIILAGCPYYTSSDLFVAELVGTSYLKLATS